MSFLLVYKEKTRERSWALKTARCHETTVRFPGLFKTLLLLPLLMIGATAAAQSDNQYCRSGDTADFGATKDGPAALPNRCINTALSSTPSPGKKINVTDPSGVAAALQSASCGDTLVLSAGKTFAPFILPSKRCDAAHWITIRTSAESELPPEGTRLTPCHAGHTSLPDRPAYNCRTPNNALVRIELKSGAGAINVAAGANHYRIIGLEITRTAGTGTVFALIRFEDGADHVVIDRSWIHGTPLDETVRGINLGAAATLELLIRTSMISTA